MVDRNREIKFMWLTLLQLGQDFDNDDDHNDLKPVISSLK